MSRQLITFEIGDRRLGIDIMAVREIRAWSPATPLPNVPPHVRGVVNLRGEIVPIVDLALLFGFPQALPLHDASIIVLKVDGRLVGLAVSSVSDVIGLADEEILPAPELGDRAIANAISGIGSRDGASLLLLDVDQLMKRVREERE